MRASTAAGINPCVRTPPPAYMSSVCHRMQLRGISRWAFPGGAVWGKEASSLAFVGFPVALSGEETFPLAFLAFGVIVSAAVLYGKSPLFPDICDIRYRRGPPPVRNMRAVQEKASYGTRCVFRSTRCKKQASVYFPDLG